jgi:hypothetical protein
MVHAPQSSITASLSSIRVLSSPRAVLLVMFTSYSFVFSTLHTLCIIWRSFFASNPLFSSSYRLFCKNTGGWGIPFAASVSFPRGLVNVERALCLGYSRYLLSHHQYVTLCQRIRSGTRCVSSCCRQRVCPRTGP